MFSSTALRWLSWRAASWAQDSWISSFPGCAPRFPREISPRVKTETSIPGRGWIRSPGGYIKVTKKQTGHLNMDHRQIKSSTVHIGGSFRRRTSHQSPPFSRRRVVSPSSSAHSSANCRHVRSSSTPTLARMYFGTASTFPLHCNRPSRLTARI